MEILKVYEAVAGFCKMDCDFTQDEINFFVGYAVNDILKKQIERMKHELRGNGDETV